MKRPTPEEQRILSEIVEAELEPYRMLVSPEMLEWIREEAMALLSAHPYPVALSRQLTADPVVQESGVLGPGAEKIEEDAAVSSGGRGRGGR